MTNGTRIGRLGSWGTLLGTVVIVLITAGLTLPSASAQGWQGQQYGSNFGWSYSTPRTTYYNGPAIGWVGPYGYPYYGYGAGGNVQYFRRGRNAFAVETYRDQNGRIQQRTGVFYYGGR